MKEEEQMSRLNLPGFPCFNRSKPKRHRGFGGCTVLFCREREVPEPDRGSARNWSNISLIAVFRWRLYSQNTKVSQRRVLRTCPTWDHLIRDPKLVDILGALFLKSDPVC